MIGKTLGHYQITTQLGRGGMGEVYQAKDQKLGRDVAIKLLPEEFARDTDRVARFQREAKLLASLNHPNIAVIYGLEESDGISFLVLELVQGETLADQLKRGPIPVEESLKLALQITEALEAAHEKGVIHRDLKPANIKITPDGKVKVLDFGLAKAFAGDQAELNLSNSPTLSNAATQQGVILGTAGYMSPEQARGKSVDKKTDIWAFGCVLFEMLTGRTAFQGEDVSEILASVIKGDVKLDLLPAIQPRVREAITRCLQKDVKRRYQDIGDARYEIEQALADPAGASMQPVTAVEPRNKLRTILPWIAAAIVLTAVIAGVAVWKAKSPEPRQVGRFSYELPVDQQFGDLFDRALAVSPDGRQFVYTTSRGLYLRSMDKLDAKLIAGTEGNSLYPFFSPDGKWVGYLSIPENKLKKAAVSGGVPVSITDAQKSNAAITGICNWGVDDTIVYAAFHRGILRVSATGGPSEVIVKEENAIIKSAQILPDGKSVMFTRVNTIGSGTIIVQSLKSGQRKELFSGQSARYLPTGHIVYAAENSLLAVPFNLEKLEVEGEPVSLVEGVLDTGGGPQYAISDLGTLIYMPGTAIGTARAQRTLVWLDRKGKEEQLAFKPDDYSDPRISPDGTRVAVAVQPAGKSDIWILDLVRKNMTRLTFDENGASSPQWTLDAQRIIFSSAQGLCWKAADGTGKVETLASVPDKSAYPSSWADDGKTLILIAHGVSFVDEIGALPMEDDRKYRSLLQEKYNETLPKISPGGRWMAYTSDVSGQYEVYVRPFPELDKGQWQVSTGRGDSPLWSPDGRELFYRNGDSVMAVAVQTEAAFKAGIPGTLFRGMYVYVSVGGYDLHTWDISPDGKRFLMMKEAVSAGKPAAAETPRKINIVLNWLEELKQRVPVK
jgi:serine/threonine protein kinase/Tol biopolymer transport system component